MSIIRKATAADARTVAQLAESVFRHAFADQNTTEDMNLHCQISYGEAIQAKEIANPAYRTLVVEEQDQLIAYAQLRWAKTPSCVVAKSPGEILRIYVDHVWHGKGVAQLLLQACLDHLEQSHVDVAWLGVWEHNPRAITFYRKFGFEAVGHHTFIVGTDPQRDIIMVRPIRR